MTKKRFIISFENNQNIYDREEKCYYSSIDAEKLCDLLNDIEQEARDNEHYHSEVLRLYKAVSEENEELKTTISRLIEQNRKNNDLLVSDIRLLEKALWCPNCARNIKRLRELKKEFEND